MFPALLIYHVRPFLFLSPLYQAQHTYLILGVRCEVFIVSRPFFAKKVVTLFSVRNSDETTSSTVSYFFFRFDAILKKGDIFVLFAKHDN